MTHTTDIPALVAELKRLAEAATSGEWVPVSEAYGNGAATDYGVKVEGRTTIYYTGDEENAEQDAAFIAAANPANVLALLAHLRTVEEERDAFRTYAHEATIAITDHVGGGSELFAGRIAKGTDRELYKADLPFCLQRLRERRNDMHERWTSAMLQKNEERARAEAAERDRDAGKATIAGLVEALKPFGRDAVNWWESVDDEYRPRCTEPGKDYAHPGSESAFKVGDLRRAARAVAGATAGPGGAG